MQCAAQILTSNSMYYNKMVMDTRNWPIRLVDCFAGLFVLPALAAFQRCTQQFQATQNVSVSTIGFACRLFNVSCTAGCLLPSLSSHSLSWQQRSTDPVHMVMWAGTSLGRVHGSRRPTIIASMQVSMLFATCRQSTSQGCRANPYGPFPSRKHMQSCTKAKMPVSRQMLTKRHMIWWQM